MLTGMDLGQRPTGVERGKQRQRDYERGDGDAEQRAVGVPEYQDADGNSDKSGGDDGQRAAQRYVLPRLQYHEREHEDGDGVYQHHRRLRIYQQQQRGYGGYADAEADRAEYERAREHKHSDQQELRYGKSIQILLPTAPAILRYRLTGKNAGAALAVNRNLPVHQHIGDTRRELARVVVGGVVVDALGVEHHDVGKSARLDATATT